VGRKQPHPGLLKKLVAGYNNGREEAEKPLVTNKDGISVKAWNPTIKFKTNDAGTHDNSTMFRNRSGVINQTKREGSKWNTHQAF